jgi:hypothetical protein
MRNPMMFILAIASLVAGACPALRAQQSLARPKALPLFAHPLVITNAYLPLGTIRQQILEGKDGDARLRVERSVLPSVRRSFTVAGQVIETVAVESRTYADDRLTEAVRDFFAQSDDGTVCHLGHGVDQYADGQVVAHTGSWLLAANSRLPTVILPALPKVGDRFQTVDVPMSVREEDEVVSLSESVTVPAGTFGNCLQIKAVLADGKVRHRYYAEGVGCVREVWDQGELRLTSRTMRVASKTGATANPTKRQLADPLSRVALRFVGADPTAEEYWHAAINDPRLSAHEREDLIEDLNEEGFSDPKRPSLADLPLILNRIQIVLTIAPYAMDQANADAFKEAYKDLTNMARKLLGQTGPR